MPSFILVLRTYNRIAQIQFCYIYAMNEPYIVNLNEQNLAEVVS